MTDYTELRLDPDRDPVAAAEIRYADEAAGVDLVAETDGRLKKKFWLFQDVTVTMPRYFWILLLAIGIVQVLRLFI